jgi:hypothetical protein
MWLLKFEILVSIGFDLWKALKLASVKRRPDNKFPFIEIVLNRTYADTTRKFEMSAAKYINMVMVPLLVGYFGYSYQTKVYKSIYSFVLESLVGAIYYFGFLMMAYPVYINYKMKSVAHLPWKMLIYKFLNTIIDDFFALIVDMPLLKRISCFRDGTFL